MHSCECEETSTFKERETGRNVRTVEHLVGQHDAGGGEGEMPVPEELVKTKACRALVKALQPSPSDFAKGWV